MDTIKYGLLVIRNDSDQKYFEENRYTKSDNVDIERVVMVSSNKEKVVEYLEENTSWDCRPTGDTNLWYDPASDLSYGIMEIIFY